MAVAEISCSPLTLCSSAEGATLPVPLALRLRLPVLVAVLSLEVAIVFLSFDHILGPTQLRGSSWGQPVATCAAR